MGEIVVYVHGKGGSAQEAEHYKALFPDCEVIGFDYHAQSPWEATEEFSGFFTAVRKRCGKLTLVANSIGAFLSLSSLNEKLVDTAYFISPVVDMEQLICNMMQWADVSEAELAEKLEISPSPPSSFFTMNFSAFPRCLTCKKPNRTVKRNPVIRIRMINGSHQTTPSNQVIKLLICVNMFSFLHPFA